MGGVLFSSRDIPFCPQRFAERSPTELRTDKGEELKGDEGDVSVRRGRVLEGDGTLLRHYILVWD